MIRLFVRTDNTHSRRNGADAEEEYFYDANGNMTKDLNKGISDIRYNYLNLPYKIEFSNGNYIQLTYDASGAQLRKTVVTPEGTHTTDYVSGIEYHDEQLSAIYHDEGRVTVSPEGAFRYEYVLRDHLGNTRSTFSDIDGNGRINHVLEVLQEDHYYPFGMNHTGPWNPASETNPYKFNGKEWNGDLGLNWYSYGARWYDPAVGRWWSVDPMAEKYANMSPYVYVADNPVMLIDPNGRFPIDPAILEKFPRLSAFIQNGGLEKYITGSDRMLSVLSRYSSGFLTRDQIHNDFEQTNGPQLVMVSNQELKGRGFDNPSDFGGHWDYHYGTIELGEAYLSRIEKFLEKFDGDEKKTTSLLMEFTKTFVNEFTHYGDFQDGLDMQIGEDGTWQNIGPEPDFKDDEGNQAAGELFPFDSGLLNYEMYKEGKHIPNNTDETMIPKLE